jgi:hypothetical protein
VVAEHHVLRDAERLDETEVLVHPSRRRVERVARRVELDWLAPQPDLPSVRTVEAVRMFDSVVLPAPFLAEQRVDLAGGRLEVDVLVGDDGGEALGDPPQRDCGRWRGGLGLPAARTISPWRYRSRL